MKSRRAKTFQIYGVPLLSIIAALTIIPTLLNMFQDVPLDFAVFMRSARALRNGLDPYRELLVLDAPNTNPPVFLFAMLPLAGSSDRVAFDIWTAASMLALIFSLEKTAKALNVSFGYLLIVALGLQSVSAAMRFGQVTFFLPLLTLGWLADRNDHKDAAGGWLGALIYLKPFVGLYGLYMVWRREWRILRSMVGVFVVLVLFGLLAGVDTTVSWIETLGRLSGKVAHVVNASWPALPARIFTVDVSQPNSQFTPWLVAPRMAVALWVAGSLVIGLTTLWAIQRTAHVDAQWSIVAAAMLLLSPLGWMYYLPLLLPPLAATIFLLPRLVPVLIAGAILWVPSSVLARNHFGPLATATIGSAYTWGLLLVWASLCVEGPRDKGVTTLG